MTRLWRITRWTLALAALLAAFTLPALAQDDDAADDADEAAPHPILEPAQTPLVMAHQGGDGLRPGNTMAAFEHAVELGVDVLEMDIHSTSDGVIVVIHDDTVDRTTNGEGRVQDFTFEDLQALDAGYDWPTLAEAQDIEGYPFRGQGITIPALEEVLAAFPDMPMNIEIKQREPSIVIPLCELLNEYDMQDQVLIASFHPETVEEFREDCPDIPTSGYEDEILRFFLMTSSGRGDDYETTATAFQVPEYQGNLQVITPEFVASAASIGVQVHVWTPNTADDLQRMIDAEVDGIITDYPDVLLDLLDRSAEAE